MRVLLCVLALLFVAPVRAAEAPADLVLWGGPIHTADDARPTAQAVAVRADRIAYVGDREGAQALVGPKTRVVHLRGAALFPGFVDAHAHLRGIGERELTLNLEGTTSVAALVERLRAEATQARPGEVIVGRGWIETGWPEGRFPTAADLDAAAPDNPVLLERADGHALVANSAALKRAGIDARTVAPAGGEILKNAAGRPTGMLIDNAMRLVARLPAQPSPEQIARAYQTGGAVHARYGWTGLHNMSVALSDVPVIERLSADGRLPLRVYNAVNPDDLDALIRSGPRRSANRRIETRAVKLYVDGALGSRGAALLEPYADMPSSRGLLLLERAAALKAFGRARDGGVQVATHAIGDRGNRLLLDWYAESFKGRPAADRRWRVEHAQVLDGADLPRFAQLGVIASMQPSHAIGDLHFAPARLGQARLAGAYAWRSILESGAHLAGGSDAPVERGDPLVEFYAAVARRDLKGFSGEGWHPEQALDRQAALKLFTAWPAYAAFQERELGTIAVGKRADLTVFSVDLMTAPVDAIPKGRALLTLVDGQTAYRAEGW
jgi:hypothetical protein